MSDRYLTDLADVLRGSGLDVIEVDGWQSRARGSGGYADGRPNHVMVHHTASPPSSDGWPDVNYICFNAEYAPVSNLYLSRTGTIYVCAAGATNTNGSGFDPCGVVPPDSMNSHAIGIEAANNGVGERWPDVQLDVYIRLCQTLTIWYGINVIHSHFEYAPGRKIDPAGPDRYAVGSAMWDMTKFLADVWEPTPIPTPIPGDDDMPLALILEDAREPHAMYRCGPAGKVWIRDGDSAAQVHRRLEESQGGTVPSPVDGMTYKLLSHGGNDVIASYGPILGPRPDGHDEYGRH